MQAPVYVLNTTTKRETGRKAQLANCAAAKAVANIVRTSLGPKAMLKMLLSQMGGIVITNDGNAILREIEVNHPAAKNLIDLSRTQDEEVGDGTTSVIILAGELMQVAEPFLLRNMHPTVIIGGFRKALEDVVEYAQSVAWRVDVSKREEVARVVAACLGTKFTTRWSTLLCQLALDSVELVAEGPAGSAAAVDLKRLVRVEKVPGGDLADSRVLRGVMFNKDVTHPQMRRRIVNPRVLLLDCSLEYKKGESATQAEIGKETDYAELLRQEEEQVQRMCADIVRVKPDVVITEKGLSDLAQHLLLKHNITALRRLRKTDNVRVAKACGATIVNRTEEIKDSDVGTGAGLFEVQKIGDEYFTFIVECKAPKACTVVLRGASKDVLAEVERNLTDALCVGRNVWADARLVAGGGALETAAAALLADRARQLGSVLQWPYAAVAHALEAIPRTLALNCGANPVRLLTELRAKYAGGEYKKGAVWGIDGNTGKLANTRELGIWEPLAVKLQSIKTAVEAACLLLRVDDIVSGSKKGAAQAGGGGAAESDEKDD